MCLYESNLEISINESMRFVTSLCSFFLHLLLYLGMMNVCGNYICNCIFGEVELDVYVCGPIKKALF